MVQLVDTGLERLPVAAAAAVSYGRSVMMTPFCTRVGTEGRQRGALVDRDLDDAGT